MSYAAVYGLILPFILPKSWLEYEVLPIQLIVVPEVTFVAAFTFNGNKSNEIENMNISIKKKGNRFMCRHKIFDGLKVFFFIIFLTFITSKPVKAEDYTNLSSNQVFLSAGVSKIEMSHTGVWVGVGKSSDSSTVVSSSSASSTVQIYGYKKTDGFQTLLYTSTANAVARSTCAISGVQNTVVNTYTVSDSIKSDYFMLKVVYNVGTVYISGSASHASGGGSTVLNYIRAYGTVPVSSYTDTSSDTWVSLDNLDYLEMSHTGVWVGVGKSSDSSTVVSSSSASSTVTVYGYRKSDGATVELYTSTANAVGKSTCATSGYQTTTVNIFVPSQTVKQTYSKVKAVYQGNSVTIKGSASHAPGGGSTVLNYIRYASHPHSYTLTVVNEIWIVPFDCTFFNAETKLNKCSDGFQFYLS